MPFGKIMYDDGKFESYKDLIVWQKSIRLADYVYRLTVTFPTQERFGLSSQMQRAAVSISSNIAEGFDRNHPSEFLQFLGIAYGSSAELETQLLIAEKRYPSDLYEIIYNLLGEVRKMLRVLIAKQKSRK